MSYGIKLRIWGEFACFTRPEMKVERVSYDVITPSAARGILEAIYWKPQFRWHVDRIHVLNPIRWTSVRRNEVADKASTSEIKKAMNGTPVSLGIEIESSRQQRAALILRDVAYGLEASIEVLDFRFEPGGPELSERECAGKHLACFERRAKSGAHFHQPYFGTREFPVAYEWLDQTREFPPSQLDEADRRKDLGFMLYDVNFVESKSGKIIDSNRGRRLEKRPLFYRPQLRDGIINVRADFAATGIETKLDA